MRRRVLLTGLAAAFLARSNRPVLARAEAAAPIRSLSPLPVRDAPLETVTVIDGASLSASGVGPIRLCGIRPPLLPLDRPVVAGWPAQDAAAAAMQRLVTGGRLEFFRDGPVRNRYGDLLVHVLVTPIRAAGDDVATGVIANPVWLQGALLSAGHAQVETRADQRALATEMLAAETEARRASRGLWQESYYRTIAPWQAGKAIGGFRLVEGRVLSVAGVRGITYLNFGRNWREDFTVSWDRRAARLFKAAGIDPVHFEGRTLRVRGWLIERNGPMIVATHPEQIELFA